MTTQPRALKGAGILVNETDWEAIYREYLPRVYNFFRYRLSDDSLVQDLTAVTFEKAWRSRERFRRNLSSFSTWLFTIARNVAVDHFRRDGREVPLQTVREQADPISLEEAVQRKQDSVRLRFLLALLPEREREVLAFKYGAGLNNREIAHLLNLSESNVGTIVHRVVEKLRVEMEANHE